MVQVQQGISVSSIRAISVTSHHGGYPVTSSHGYHGTSMHGYHPSSMHYCNSVRRPLFGEICGRVICGYDVRRYYSTQNSDASSSMSSRQKENAIDQFWKKVYSRGSGSMSSSDISLAIASRLALRFSIRGIQMGILIFDLGSCILTKNVTLCMDSGDPSSILNMEEMSPPAYPDDSSSSDEFGIDVLLESWPRSMGSTETGTSVNQPEAGGVPPANPGAPRGDEAGPANQTPPAVPYPYKLDEVIGGDSVLSIQRRLLDKTSPLPLPHEIDIARVQAEDLFEVKAEIVKLMAVLDPYGDWMGRGARALDNPHTSTGEPSLERLHIILNDLRGRGAEILGSGIFPS